ncbi:MAG: aminoglycoside phosphotransferase family protein [Gammaproteobacteria bacterium]|nr:aminoglycoside phosphotransferase family protein [Gammaproteobacteria bacterium]
MNSSIIFNVDLAHELIHAQFPQWAALSIKPVEPGGWDNRTFRLGKEMTIRLPSAEVYAAQVKKEQYWLPKLAPALPLSIPTPLAMGSPSKQYPWHWSIYNWLKGETASVERIQDLSQFAVALAEFLIALQHSDTTEGPIAGSHNFFRGGALSTYDEQTRQAIAVYQDKATAKAMMTVWETALASHWQNPPLWIHGDIAIGNLLVQNGKLCAVIDFGQLGIGDPACDLVIAWTLFTGKSRDAFKAALALDKDTWARSRGWALWKALIAPLPGTENTFQQVIEAILTDQDN